MSRPYCNELWVIKSAKSSDVCSPSGLSGSLQKVLLRALMDWMKCEFSQPSRLADFPWTHLQSPRVFNWVNVLIFRFSLSWSVVCSVLPLVVQHQPDPFYHPVSGFWFWFLAFIPGTCTLFSFYLFYFRSFSHFSCLCALSLGPLCVNLTVLSRESAFYIVSRHFWRSLTLF